MRYATTNGEAQKERLFGVKSILPSGSTLAFLCLSAWPKAHISNVALRTKIDNSRTIPIEWFQVIGTILSRLSAFRNHGGVHYF